MYPSARQVSAACSNAAKGELFQAAYLRFRTHVQKTEHRLINEAGTSLRLGRFVATRAASVRDIANRDRWRQRRDARRMNDHLDQPSRLSDSLLGKLRELRAGTEVVVFLDYDGTLVPFASLPELAGPDPDLLSTLARLTNRRGTRVHLVSG